ncbi:MAG: acetate/propionate family kinase [Hyphomicrobiales bacterium]
MSDTILTLNAGSSSIKFSIYSAAEEPIQRVRGQVENLGPTARLIIKEEGEEEREIELGAANHMSALKAVLEHSRTFLTNTPISGIGHRIAHGGIDFTHPVELTDTALAKLQVLAPLAPLHQPHNLKVVAAAKEAFPEAKQIGCFDTSFHRGHPWVNDTFGLPRKYYEKGVRRYGFHGLSYDYITSELEHLEPDLAKGRVVIAHLGNGASMCAVKSGSSIASTMGFSALDGLPMGTRCGQLDPGVLLYLMDQENMSADQISDLLYKESGLKGLSGMSNDMRALTASERPEAKQALDYYAFRVRRELGAMIAVLGGIDAFVFCGGIGENSAPMRAQICEGMEWIDIGIDPMKNDANALNIGSSKTRVLVIPTDEERVIARATLEIMNTA